MRAATLFNRLKDHIGNQQIFSRVFALVKPIYEDSAKELRVSVGSEDLEPIYSELRKLRDIRSESPSEVDLSEYIDSLSSIPVDPEFFTLPIVEGIYAPEVLLKVLLYRPHLTPEGVTFYASLQGVKDRKYIETTYGRFCTRILGLPADAAEKHHAQYKARVGKTGVKFIENNDVTGWKQAYSSRRAPSCMRNKAVAGCYAIGTKSNPTGNGLRLAYLGESPDICVARAIVHEPTKTFVRVYGDSNLMQALEHLGYTKADGWPVGIRLRTRYSSDKSKLKVPFVDGDVFNAELVQDKQNLFMELQSKGPYYLRQQSTWISVLNSCDCCGRRLTGSTTPEVQVDLDTFEVSEVKSNVCGACAIDQGLALVLHPEESRRVWAESKYIWADSKSIWDGRLLREGDIERNNLEWSPVQEAWIQDPVFIPSKGYSVGKSSAAQVFNEDGTQVWETLSSLSKLEARGGYLYVLKDTKVEGHQLLGHDEFLNGTSVPSARWTAANQDLARRWWGTLLGSSVAGSLMVDHIVNTYKASAATY